MPRIPGSSSPVAPRFTTPTAPTADVQNTSVTTGVQNGFETARSESVFEAYFTPYDPAAKAEVALLDKVMAARKADPTVYPKGENPYKIQYAVYNLRSPGIIKRLIEATKMGVDVQVLIESAQIAPDRPWNKVDETFADAGLSVVYSDREAPEEVRNAAHLVGIESNHLMHMKARIFQYKDPDTGELEHAVLSGSMNPGDGASKNDENLNLIEMPSVVKQYQEKFDDVLNARRSINTWDADRGLNVLFTPNKGGPRPIEKLFEWIDAENELIMLSVFDIKNIKDPVSRKSLVDKLAEAKDRGVEVAVITDRKKSDGLDSEGNRVFMYGHAASNNWFDEDLEKHGIPVYEFTNEAGEFNAMHPKAAIFGLTDMKVISGAGNWTRAGMGSGNKRGRNEETFIFVESNKLDNNRTGMRYLANALYLLRNYDHQNTEHDPAETFIDRLQQREGWPEVSLDPTSLLPPDFEGEAYLVGEHPALEGRNGEPGLKLSTRSNLLSAMTRPQLSVPFGTSLTYDVVTRDAQGQETVIGDDLTLVVMPDNVAKPRIPGAE